MHTHFNTTYPKSELFVKVMEIMSIVKDLNAASALLSWDQETYMPHGAIQARADQIATIDSLAHRSLTSDQARLAAEEIRNILEFAEPFEKGIYRSFLLEHDIAVKLPESFVNEFSRMKSIASETWKKAKFESNFALFQNALEEILKLKIEQTDYLGFTGNIYNALLGLFEPEMTTDILDSVFNKLKTETIAILNKLEPLRDEIDDDIVHRYYNHSLQEKLARFIADKLTFDFHHGRMDISVHPFSTSFSSKDVRITTRINENNLLTCLMSTIHEVGHGLYEQGMDKALYRTFAQDGASFGIHESQSLFWENTIGRSKEFWIWLMPHLREAFPNSVANSSVTTIYKAVNKVKRSFIRTEADELTYNLHIILRYEIEKALLNGKMIVRDIPAVWNAKMKEYLGIVPPKDSLGCLQDIHWSHGGFGYFPTYTLGKLYAAMFRKKIIQDIPELKTNVASGNFNPLKQWLRENIHKYGRLELPKEILMRVTGKELTETDFLEYIKGKISSIYEINPD